MKKLLSIALVLLFFCAFAHAHPMGNFSINHHTRFDINASEIKIIYSLDFAEIPSIEQMDKNANGMVDASELEQYRSDMLAGLLKNLTLQVNEVRVDPKLVTCSIVGRPGAAGLTTVLLRATLSLPLAKLPVRIKYLDKNFSSRLGIPKAHC